MPTLTDDVKSFIVQALACHDTPQQVVEAVKEEFNISLPRSHVQAYDPTKHAGRQLSQKWRDVFESTRAKFLDNVSDIPIANQTYRLRRLSRLLDVAEKRGNAVLAASLLEQAAKEVGGMFTNRRELTGKGGSPLMPTKEPADLTEEELRAELLKHGVNPDDL